MIIKYVLFWRTGLFLMFWLIFLCICLWADHIMTFKLGVIEFKFWSSSLTLVNFPIINWLETRNMLVSRIFLFTPWGISRKNVIFFWKVLETISHPTQQCNLVWITVCQRPSALGVWNPYIICSEMVVCNIHMQAM